MNTSKVSGRAYRAVCMTVLITASFTASAADEDAGRATTGSDDSIFVLGAVVIEGKRTGPQTSRDVLTSVDVIGSDLVETQNVDSAWELFSHAPGVMLTEFNQGTTSGKLSFRAFNGEGEINAVKLLIDGIPSNSNDGNMPFIDAIFPLDIESLEVVRGTNDARHGLYNIAGNVSLRTWQEGDHTRARLSAGSYGTQEAQVSKGIETGAWSQNYVFGYRRSDGYRDHSEGDKYGLAGKWFYRLDENGARVGLMARHYNHDTEEPGYLTLSDARATPRRSYDFSASDGSERRIGQYSFHLDMDPSERWFWSTKAYLNRYRDQRFIKFSAGASQQERDTYETHFGLLSTVTRHARGDGVALEAGFNAERQNNQSLRYTTVNRVRQTQTRDQDFHLDTVGGYVQAVVRTFPALKLVPAWRVDHVSGGFTDRLTGVSADANDYGLISQPKFSAFWTLAEGYALYGNWGRSFQVGVGASTYKIPPRTRDLDPSINTGWETGLKLNPADWLEGRVAVWTQTATGEERRRLNDPSNDSDNIGKTRRRGMDVQFDLRPAPSLDMWLAYSWQDSEILEPDPSAPDTRGKEIDHVPHHLYTAGVHWRIKPEVTLALSASGQSSYYLERNNTQGKFGDYLVVNAGATWQVTEHLALDFQIRNLADRYYEYVWHDGTQSLHSPADERAFHVGASLKL